MKISSLAWIVATIHISTAAAAVRDIHCFKSHPGEVRKPEKPPEDTILKFDQWESNCSEADRAACSGRCEGTVSDQELFVFTSLTMSSVRQEILSLWPLLRAAAIAGAMVDMERRTW